MIKKYTKNRERLVKLLSASNGLISISDAAKILDIPRDKARSILWSMTKSGWIKSIKSGLYTVVPLEASSPSMSEENSFVVANKLFPQCYIGGWNAANFWGFTDQLFASTWIMTTKNVTYKEQNAGNHAFILTQIKPSYLFGTQTEWIQNTKVMISDPSKTLIDFLNFSESFSVSSMVDIFKAYVNSEHKNLALLKEYAIATQNKSIFKRLGFLMERFLSSEKVFIDFCQQNISKGYSAMSSLSKCDRIVTKWNIRIPSTFVEK